MVQYRVLLFCLAQNLVRQLPFGYQIQFRLLKVHFSDSLILPSMAV